MQDVKIQKISESYEKENKMSIYRITEYGAKPDIAELQTAAIQSAIDACAKAGGGTVYVPTGFYRTGTIQLYSNITLYLENGAVLKGPDNIEDYRKYPFAWTLYPYTIALILAVNAKNIRICGEGAIDFNGIAFAKTDKLSVNPETPAELLTDVHYEMPERDKRPNRLVFFQSCEDVEISGVTFIDSPTWTLVFHDCSFLKLHDFRVKNDLRIPNNDGVHCCGCKDVIISGCFFNCGDDCIAVTCIADESLVNERFVISDCIFQSASAALRLGFMGAKLKDFVIRNSIIRDSNRGIAIFAGENGWVENISVDGLTIDTRIYAGYWWGKGEPLVICSSDKNAYIRNIEFRNTVIRAENSIIVSGMDSSVSDVRIDNARIELAYGTRRPWFGSQIDLCPNKCKPAPEAEKNIPWLWRDGGSEVESTRINVRRKEGEQIEFDTKEMIQG